ncbi:MAG: chalcone isomerase family protein [Pirellulaceae bacterium]
MSAGALAATISAGPAAAGQVGRVRFEDQVRAGSTLLHLQGAGLVYYRSLIKGLAAGLYLDERTKPQDILADVPKRIEIEYFWSLKATTISGALAKPLAANVPAARLAALQEKVDRLHAAMVNVQAGDRYALTYVPGIGTWLSHNGKTLQTIPGAEFAAAYFSIWFGDQPMDPKLKRQLLGE